MDLGLRGMKAVLAGATQGIGRATAEALADEGCDVAICARKQEGIDDTLKALRGKGVTAIGASVDVTDAAALRRWVAESAEALGGCDIFIFFASAGGGPASEESWKANFDIDLMGTFRGIDAALPYLEKSKAGSIVVVGSTAALEYFAMPQAYNAIKAAVINYASSLSQALGPKGIRVNAVSPGPVFFKDGDWDQIKTHMTAFYDQIVASIPQGRLGEGGEVARAITFVASPACPFMTGANLVLDGGLTKRVQY